MITATPRQLTERFTTSGITGKRQAQIGDTVYTVEVHYSKRGNRSSRPGQLYRNGWMIWVAQPGLVNFPWRWVSTLRVADQAIKEFDESR